MPRVRPYREQQVIEMRDAFIVELFELGFTTSEIGTAVNRTKQFISQVLKKYVRRKLR